MIAAFLLLVPSLVLALALPSPWCLLALPPALLAAWLGLRKPR